MENSSDCYISLDHSLTHSFSKLIVDYLEKNSGLTSFYQYSPDLNGIKNAIDQRRFSDENRGVLVDVLTEQYQDLSFKKAVEDNLQRLKQSNTYTITTAHQPNLLGGPLYFIYKIIHAIKLANFLTEQIKDKSFVPIFYIGSEDNDLEELGHFFFYGKDYKWKTTQKGAVGRMSTQDLQPLLLELFSKMGPPGPYLNQLRDIIKNAFAPKNNIGRATQIFVHELLGSMGIIVLNPDDARLKSLFSQVMEDDLMNHSAAKIVEQTSQKMSNLYKSQAYVRDVNLFYLKDDIRERIEKVGERWNVMNTDFSFSKDEILKELSLFPERFSPNVILRGIYQETILPNVAFIGGGAEVAYWMQLKDLFNYYKTDFPTLILRQSFVLIDSSTKEQIDKVALPHTFIFENPDDVLKNVALDNNENIKVELEKSAILDVLEKIKKSASEVDITLLDSAESAISKINKQLNVLSKKMLRAEKKKYEILKNRLYSIRQHLYPNGVMQERKQSFMDYYLTLGDDFFTLLYKGIYPFGEKFVIINLP